MRALVAAVVAGAVVCLAGAAGGGIFVPPPPGDRAPTWSPDASVIVFLSDRDGTSLRVVRPDGGDEHRIEWLPATAAYSFSPGWSRIAAEQDRQLVVERLDGSDRRSLGPALYLARASWSPDGTRVVYMAPSTTPNRADVVVARVDGTEARRIAEGIEPTWSPAGDRIAYLDGEFSHRRLRVIRPDGSEGTPLTASPGDYDAPTWSPDGTRLAVLHRAAGGVRPALELLRLDGARIASFPHVASADYAWSPRGERIAFSNGEGVFVLDVASGRAREVSPFGSQVAWSPDGAELAFAAGGECRDRAAIYRVRLDGSQPVRLTNGCRIVGTAGADVISGTPLADVLVGLAGDDRLTAVAGFYVGDVLDGGPGDDALVGSDRGDTLDGGPGADTLRAGPGPDVLTGGPGRDVLAGEGGRDVVHARDGEPDRVSCGTNATRSVGPEDDVAYVDRLDRVARDCEWVFRPGAAPPARGRTSLLIRVWPEGLRGRSSPRREYTLRCRPAGGTLPRPGLACARLVAIQNPFAPIPPGLACAFVYGGPELASVRGLYGGRAVRTTFSRVSSCEIERWDRLAFLFPLPKR